MEEFAKVLAERIEKHISSFEHKVLAHHPDIAVVSVTEYAYVEEFITAKNRSMYTGYAFTEAITDMVIGLINKGSKFSATKIDPDIMRLEVK